MIRPVALYGSQCKTTTAKETQMLHVAEMNILRWCLNITRLDHATNEEVRAAMGVAPIQDKAQQLRIQWFGHVQRSNDDTVIQQAMLVNPDGKRPRGQPKKRWADQVREDLKKIGATEDDALDRVRWRRLCMVADPVIVTIIM